MASKLTRLGLLAGLGILLAGVVAWSQDRGAAEPAGQSRVDVFNPVEGRAVVIASRPDGTRVEKGDVICELDPSELRDRLASQDTVVLGAQAEVNGTRIGREVTVLTLIEYKQGAFKLEFATVEGEIKLAEAKLAGRGSGGLVSADVRKGLRFQERKDLKRAGAQAGPIRP